MTATTLHSDQFEAMRIAMVASQLRPSGVTDPRVIAAMAETPRERFVPAGMEELAYRDSTINLGEGRRANTPLATARLLVEARLRPSDRVLLIGAAMGYTAAVLAQIVAEVSTIAETTWATRHPPRFMPDDVDGRVLFDTATREEAARKAGTHADGVSGLGDIVMVPSVRAARDRGVLRPRPLFDRLTAEGAAWSDGTMDPYDAIIWCTGFRPALNHLASLGLRRENGVPKTIGTRSADEPRLHLLGYGDWTGFASATLIGTGRTAKDAVHDITSHLPAASPPQ